MEFNFCIASKWKCLSHLVRSNDKNLSIIWWKIMSIFPVLVYLFFTAKYQRSILCYRGLYRPFLLFIRSSKVNLPLYWDSSLISTPDNVVFMNSELFGPVSIYTGIFQQQQVYYFTKVNNPLIWSILSWNGDKFYLIIFAS